MLFGCAVLETKSTRKLKNGQSLNQCVDLLVAHAVREEIAGERFCVVNIQKLCLVINAGVIHQARVEFQIMEIGSAPVRRVRHQWWPSW